MKRLLMIAIIFFLPLTFAGCGQSRSDPIGRGVPDTLYFTSLVEFLESTRIARTGRAVGEFAELADSVNLLGLEEFYLPIGIPEAYKIYRISVTEDFVSLWYLPEEHLVSEGAARYAQARQQHFLFWFTRWDIDSPMESILGQFRVTEEDLIDGRYFFREPRTLRWASDSERVGVQIPMPTTNPQGQHVIPDGQGGHTAFAAEDLVQLAQTFTVDLTDDDLVEYLIQYGRPPAIR